jgi:hypothetical protein
MMRVNAAPGAKVVFCRHGIELVEGENIFTFGNFQARQRYGSCDCTARSTHGAIAATQFNQTFGQLQFQLYRATVTGSFVQRANYHR